MSMQVGDLVIMCYSYDDEGMTLELRDSSKKIFYSNPRQMLKVNDVGLILEIDGTDVRILTSSGMHGWIVMELLVVLSSLDGTCR